MDAFIIFILIILGLWARNAEKWEDRERELFEQTRRKYGL